MQLSCIEALLCTRHGQCNDLAIRHHGDELSDPHAECDVQGNALLVGVGGSGKQSLAKLAAFMSGCEVFEITLTRGYDETMFREDLKQLYTLLGSDNKKVRVTVVLVTCNDTTHWPRCWLEPSC